MSDAGWYRTESANQTVDRAQWKAALMRNVGRFPVIAIELRTVNRRPGQWVPSHIVFPDAFRTVNQHFTAAGQRYAGPAIYVFHGKPRQLAAAANYLLTDALFAASVDLTHMGPTIDGTIHIPISSNALRQQHFAGAVSVESNDLAAWPVEISRHKDILARYVDGFLKTKTVSLIVPESLRPSDDIVCAQPAPQMAANSVTKSLRELWTEVMVEAHLKRKKEERELRRQRDAIVGS